MHRPDGRSADKIVRVSEVVSRYRAKRNARIARASEMPKLIYRYPRLLRAKRRHGGYFSVIPPRSLLANKKEREREKETKEKSETALHSCRNPAPGIPGTTLLLATAAATAATCTHRGLFTRAAGARIKLLPSSVRSQRSR